MTDPTEQAEREMDRKVIEAATPQLVDGVPADPSERFRWMLQCGCDPSVGYCPECDNRRKMVAKAAPDPYTCVRPFTERALSRWPAALDEIDRLRAELSAIKEAERSTGVTESFLEDQMRRMLVKLFEDVENRIAEDILKTLS